MPSKLEGFWNPSGSDVIYLAPLNLTVSPVDLPCPCSDTFIIPELAAILSKGLGTRSMITSFSTLLGLAFFKPCCYAPLLALNSNCGCFSTYSDICTKEPFHSVTISLYGNSIPDLSDIAFAYFAIIKY